MIWNLKDEKNDSPEISLNNCHNDKINGILQLNDEKKRILTASLGK
jgi:hypothetical protein